MYPGKISLPFLDDNKFPSSIAMPFKRNSLFSLMTKCSVNILLKYYVIAMRCLASPGYKKLDIIEFNHEFHEWIIGTVINFMLFTNRNNTRYQKKKILHNPISLSPCSFIFYSLQFILWKLLKTYKSKYWRPLSCKKKLILDSQFNNIESV